MSTRVSSFTAFCFGVLIACYLHWTSKGRRELEWHDEQRLRDELQYQLARHGMTWEMAKWFAAKVPRAWS